MLGVGGRTDLVSESQKITISLGVPLKPEAARITPQDVSTVFLWGTERESLSLWRARPVVWLSVPFCWNCVEGGSMETPTAE